MPSIAKVLPFTSLLAGTGAVLLRNGRPSALQPRDHRVVAIPMQMYQSDCSVVDSSVIPGAGMNPDSFQPYNVVFKDGYYHVACVDDYMWMHGDKFGNNKFSYEIGETHNASIVHYSMLVPPENREPMTPDTCFRFCRTIPDMSFFGIRNGKDCYCTPFFKSVAGSNAMCDVFCEGDGRSICGSTSKSSIYGMHSCGTTATDLTGSVSNMKSIQGDLQGLVSQTTALADAMQQTAMVYQSQFGNAGDPAAANLMQTAKVRVGELTKLSTQATALSTKMTAAETEATGLSGSNYSDATALRSAEDVMRNIEGLVADGIGASEDLSRHRDESDPNATTNITGVVDQYYPALYFVDRNSSDHPSTCGGTSSHPPLFGSRDDCAHACNNDVHECVGFSFFPAAGSATQGPYKDDGLCFLMSKFKTLMYYDNCTTHSHVQCMLKFSKFEGLSLNPDPTGVCKQCFIEATERGSCFA